MDYKKAAAETIQYIGGKDNIVSAAHCATRLRLVIADNTKVNKEALEDAEGVKGVFEASGQLQIIFGTGVVNKVYDEFIQIAGVSESSKEKGSSRQQPAKPIRSSGLSRRWAIFSYRLFRPLWLPVS